MNDIFKTEELETKQLTREEIIGILVDNYNKSNGNMITKWHDAERPDDLTITFLDSNDIEFETMIIDKIYYKNFIRPTIKAGAINDN